MVSKTNRLVRATEVRILLPPQLSAEFLTNQRIGQYRFRIGNYRVVVDLKDDNVIMIVDVGHRKDIYRR